MAILEWTRQDKPPKLLKLRSSAGLIVTTCSFAIFTVILGTVLLQTELS
jgi:hypothetical protein